MPKIVHGKKYVHRKFMAELLEADELEDATFAELVFLRERRQKRISLVWNVVKVASNRVTFLEYDRFWSNPFPELLAFSTIDLAGFKEVCHRQYNTLNPPILHRKELLIPENHALYPVWHEVTRTLEKLGAYDGQMGRYGYKQSWLSRLEELGVGEIW